MLLRLLVIGYAVESALTLSGRILLICGLLWHNKAMLIDEVKISVKAGKGGTGRAAFDTSKGGRGPTGGSGGRGGDVYFEGVTDLGALRQYRHQKNFAAENGHNGRDKHIDGRGGEDLILKIPVGTVVRNLDDQKNYEIVRAGERIMVMRGGRGGRGNFHFRGPTNTSPKQFEEGRPGQEGNILLELQLIADLGLIGFPNAGKSSLLNELTAAGARVANFPFTTLEPNLGVFYTPEDVAKSEPELYGKYLILADIPGLIEGASKGKGLGYKFLKHIERTKILLHCIAADAEDIVRDYKVVKKELGEYKKELLDKKEYVCITKTDLITKKDLATKVRAIKKINPNVISVSIYDPGAIDDFKKFLTTFMVR